jgi:RNA polymerase sigma-70 factor (ECF subfamily)
MPPVSDSELLERWRGGNRRAGSQLVTRHFGDVRCYFVAKFADEHEDLTQETFSRLVAGRDRFRGGCSFRAYLFCIARNVGLEHLRTRYKAVAPLATSSLVDLTGRRCSSIAAEREEHRVLLDALRLLPLEQQELVELCYWQRLTGAELAELLGVTESAVRGRLRTAIKALGEAYRKHSGKPHAWVLEDGEVERWLEELRQRLRPGVE